MLRVVIVSVGAFADDGGERLGQPWAELFIVGDVEAGVEGLVRQSAVGVAGAGVGVVRVGEQPQRVVQECPATGVVCVALGKALVHVREACPDAVLVSLQCREVDGVGEVRGEELVALGFEAFPVGARLGQLARLGRQAFVECGLDLRHEGGEVRFSDADLLVAVGDELFGDADRDGAAVQLMRRLALPE